MGGYIFRGINGLLYHHKVTALKRGASVLQQHANKIRMVIYLKLDHSRTYILVKHSL